jgi:hypothetical protein
LLFSPALSLECGGLTPLFFSLFSPALSGVRRLTPLFFGFAFHPASTSKMNKKAASNRRTPNLLKTAQNTSGRIPTY